VRGVLDAKAQYLIATSCRAQIKTTHASDPHLDLHVNQQQENKTNHLHFDTLEFYSQLNNITKRDFQ